jgi:ABC-type transport system substrate-binding protein
MVHKALATVIAGVLLPSLLPPAQAYVAQTPTRTINGIEVSGRFLEQWSRAGTERDSVYVNGLPITPLRDEISVEDGKTYPTQWFERARYELHPDNAPPYDLLLARLGAMLVEGRGSPDPSTGQVRDPADAPFVGVEQPGDTGDGKLWFPETKHTLSGKFLEYWRRNGGLGQFGFPLSEPFEEVSPTDGQTYTVQYFERNRFELHPDKPAPYEVELGLLGVQQYRMHPVPASELPIAPPPGVASAKDEYLEAGTAYPDTLLLHETTNEAARRYVWPVTFADALVGVDDKGDYFPLAAWYVSTLENGGSYFTGSGDDRHLVTKYRLRRGLKWSDGAPLTSYDAVFSHRLLLDDPASADLTLQRRVAGVRAPNAHTVVYDWLSLNQAREVYHSPVTNKLEYDFLRPFIDLKKPVVDARYVQVGTVHPRHLLSSLPPGELRGSSYAQAPVGYGPYRVQEWLYGERLVLVANEHYTLTGRPPLKKLMVTFGEGRPSAAYAAHAGTADGISGLGLWNLPEESAQMKAAGYVVDTTPGTTLEYIGFWFEYQPFEDRAVREAIMRGINRQRIADEIFGGSAVVVNGPVLPNVYHSLENPRFASEFPVLSWEYSLPEYEYDPAEANRLLDAAGWVRGPDGVRAKDGQRLSFEYAAPRNATRQAIQELAAQDLRQLGIDPQVVNYARGFRDMDGPIYTGKCKFCQMELVSTPGSSFEQWTPSPYNTEMIVYWPNWQLYRNEKVTQANQLFKTTIDRAQVAEQSAIIQVQLMTDVAIVPIVQRSTVEIYRSTLKNRRTAGTGISQWWNITQWYFEP